MMNMLLITVSLLLTNIAIATDRATGDFGLCLDGINIPENGFVTCSDANKLPQICSFTCNPGYYTTGTTIDISCQNSLCTNTCKSVNMTCSGAVPVRRNKTCTARDLTTYDCSYTDYVIEERPCCRLEQEELGWCNIANSCTGSCSNPGIYTFDALSCPAVCIPIRDNTNPDFRCAACKLPTGYYKDVIGNPPQTATAICPQGKWGKPITTSCINSGDWYPNPSLISCNNCPPPPISKNMIDTEYFELIEEPGNITIVCKGPYWYGESKNIVCDKETGIWSKVITPNCDWRDPFVTSSPTVTPSVTSTPSTSMYIEPSPSSDPTSSPSKSPRPPKMKGSRAPSTAPKIAGSALPIIRGLLNLFM
jgi:hypothetical protein